MKGIRKKVIIAAATRLPILNTEPDNSFLADKGNGITNLSSKQETMD